MNSNCCSKPIPTPFTWADRAAWIKAMKNTFNCLIGCSIGDFATITWYQIYHPDAQPLLVMLHAMLMGLLSSIAFETILLRIKEQLSWTEGLKMAFSMSFLSMLGMEIAENLTDYFLTGGTVSVQDPWYWTALLISMAAGFLTPLPYNYYKFKKYGKACH